MGNDIRKFKFRAWSPNEFFGDNKKPGGWLTPSRIELNVDFELFDLHQENAIIQQFTESYDQNGKEVYEGDIIKFVRVWKYPNLTCTTSPKNEVYTTKGIYFIKWERGTFWLTNEKGIQEAIYYSDFSHPTTIIKEYKVIGNIFENPDILFDPATSNYSYTKNE
jgi:uncharacterized phage protein (TIGR01671 family)